MGELARLDQPALSSKTEAPWAAVAVCALLGQVDRGRVASKLLHQSSLSGAPAAERSCDPDLFHSAIGAGETQDLGIGPV